MPTGQKLDANAFLVTLLDEAFSKKSWHGTTLRGSVRGVGAELAAFRPAEGRNSIHDLVVHCAYWKYVVRRRLLGERRGSFPLPGTNWIRRSAEHWEADVRLLEEQHRALVAAVAGMRAFTPKQLWLVRGAAAHDLYHDGQIGLLKKLAA
jgi:hypothetical protein